MIEVHDIHKHFGGFHAVDGASLRIETGSITGLIGPNGAGKTTLFNVIAGVLPPTSGRVSWMARTSPACTPHELFAKGLLRTFQIAHEFSSMTCRENLMMVPGGPVGREPVEHLVRPRPHRRGGTRAARQGRRGAGVPDHRTSGRPEGGQVSAGRRSCWNWAAP
jgi:ABC-type branched-subunit amino acid transport system ATPase component